MKKEEYPKATLIAKPQVIREKLSKMLADANPFITVDGKRVVRFDSIAIKGGGGKVTATFLWKGAETFSVSGYWHEGDEIRITDVTGHSPIQTR